MKTKSRLYTREPADIQYLKFKYRNHIETTRDGFLNTRQKEKLLHIKKWEHDTSDRDVYDFFYEIRQRAKSALLDLQLVCDILSENQLEEIFTTKEEYTANIDRKVTAQKYPITELMKSLIPYPLLVGAKAQEEMMKIEEKQQWRKYILEDLVIESLLWYFHSGLFQTDAQHRLLFDTIDAIQMHSSGKKQYHLYSETGQEFGIVKF